MAIERSEYMIWDCNTAEKYLPDANKSEYRRHAREVIQRGVRMTPSDSDSASFSPCASACVKMGFFLVVVQRHIELQDCQMTMLNCSKFRLNAKGKLTRYLPH
jgi:hypothetical protein